MTDRYLYSTTVPVLLDGGRTAGWLARRLYVIFGLEPHCFGAKRHLLTRIYAKHHAALPFTKDNDPVNLRLLKAFAAEWGTGVGILAIRPGPPEAEAEAFLTRVGQELEEDYVLLDSPSPRQDPLAGLVLRH